MVPGMMYHVYSVISPILARELLRARTGHSAARNSCSTGSFPVSLPAFTAKAVQ